MNETAVHRELDKLGEAVAELADAVHALVAKFDRERMAGAAR